MKIVAIRSLKMEIDSYIDTLLSMGAEIARIELSSGEFLDMWNCVRDTQDVGRTCFEWSRYGGVKSGSYFLYRGVCIQHHISYESGDLGIEYI